MTRKQTPALVVLLALGGCMSEPTARYQTTNAEVPVSLLFEHDGCKVYRFADAGALHYYAVCDTGHAGAAMEDRLESCGKNCNHVVQRDVPVIQVRHD